jgi:copper(I)-binding protein
MRAVATLCLFTLSPFIGLGTAAACDLKVESAWIREAPPNAATLAGYAKLVNTGNAPLRIQSIQSAAFAKVEAHETLNENGMSKMRAIPILEIPAKGSVEFSPSGKHLMLMNPKQGLKKGDAVALSIQDAKSCVTEAKFVVGAGAPQAASEHEHNMPGMDHSMSHEH